MPSSSRELEPLCQALALAEGFQLLILECADIDPIGLQRILDEVLSRVTELRGAKPRLYRYDPYQTTTEEGALRDEAWVEGVLQPILELPPPADEAASVIAVIDGTRAASSDGTEWPSWLFLFHRMNERRNAIASVFAGTLAFALPPQLVRMFLEEAPDAASIRSGLFRLHAGMVPAAQALLRPSSSRPVRSGIGSDENPESALHHLLLSLFSADELFRFVATMPEGHQIIRELPGRSSSRELVHQVLQVIARHGLYPEFLQQLRMWYPGRIREIEAVAKAFTAQSVVPPRRGGLHDPSSESPLTTNVLMVSATSDPTARLHRDREFRTVLSRARHHHFYSTYVRVNGLDELTDALIRARPGVLHLSADVTPGGAPDFQPGVNVSAEVIPPRALLRLLDTRNNTVQLVIVEGLHASALAREIPSVIEYAIAVDASAPENLRIDFFVALYQALAAGRTVSDAFSIAIGGVAMQRHEDDAFVLFTAAKLQRKGASRGA